MKSIDKNLILKDFNGREFKFTEGKKHLVET